THRMIGASFDEMKARTAAFVQRAITQLSPDVKIEILDSESAVGGGAAPTSRLPTPVISITHETLTANQIEQALRHQTPPVISRIEDDRVLLDLRTVSEMDEPALEAAIVAFSLPQST